MYKNLFVPLDQEAKNALERILEESKEAAEFRAYIGKVALVYLQKALKTQRGTSLEYCILAAWHLKQKFPEIEIDLFSFLSSSSSRQYVLQVQEPQHTADTHQRRPLSYIYDPCFGKLLERTDMFQQSCEPRREFVACFLYKNVVQEVAAKCRALIGLISTLEGYFDSTDPRLTQLQTLKKELYSAIEELKKKNAASLDEFEFCKDYHRKFQRLILDIDTILSQSAPQPARSGNEENDWINDFHFSQTAPNIEEIFFKELEVQYLFEEEQQAPAAAPQTYSYSP